jgi:hypothetical protein
MQNKIFNKKYVGKIMKKITGEDKLNSILKKLVIVSSLIFVALLTAYTAKAEDQNDEMLFEIDRLLEQNNDDFVECILDVEGVCNVDTKDVEKEFVKEKTPEQFKDSKITRVTKDGKVVELDGDKYKIVPRNQNRVKVVKSKKRIKPVVIRTEYVDRDISKRNTISLVVGIAPTKLKIQESTGRYRAETDEELDFGLMYQRRFGETQRWSVGGQVQVQGGIYLNGGLNF